jgi:hypothetical protein
MLWEFYLGAQVFWILDNPDKSKHDHVEMHTFQAKKNELLQWNKDDQNQYANFRHAVSWPPTVSSWWEHKPDLLQPLPSANFLCAECTDDITNHP